MNKALIGVGVGAVVLVGAWWYYAGVNTQTAQRKDVDESVPQQQKQMVTEEEKVKPGASIGEENLVEFACVGGKKITAVFARDIVGLTLSDGRQMELRQEVSGSGIRYISVDGKVEFHGKGDEGFLEEKGVVTYSNCISSGL